MENKYQLSTLQNSPNHWGQEAIKNFTVENYEFLKRKPQKGCQCEEFRNVAQATQANHTTEDFHHKIL